MAGWRIAHRAVRLLPAQSMAALGLCDAPAVLLADRTDPWEARSAAEARLKAPRIPSLELSREAAIEKREARLEASDGR